MLYLVLFRYTHRHTCTKSHTTLLFAIALKEDIFHIELFINPKANLYLNEKKNVTLAHKSLFMKIPKIFIDIVMASFYHIIY